MIKEYKLIVDENTVNQLEKSSQLLNNLQNLLIFMITSDMTNMPQYKQYCEEYKLLIKQYELDKYNLIVNDIFANKLHIKDKVIT